MDLAIVFTILRPL